MLVPRRGRVSGNGEPQIGPGDELRVEEPARVDGVDDVISDGKKSG
jgi:hypothetical protein